MGATLPALSAPSLSGLGHWLTAGPPHWGDLPRQESGTAGGDRRQVAASATRSGGKGAGRRPGRGSGELGPASAYGLHVHPGLSHTVRGFSAKTSHRVADKSSATTDLYRNADGSFTRTISQGPVNYRADGGGWLPIDTRLHKAADGRWHEKANSRSVSLAPRASGTALARFAVDGTHSLTFGLRGAGPTAGTASGNRMTYPGILPDTDLVETTTAIGLKEAIVLQSPAAATSWVFPLSLHGLTPVKRKDGSIGLVDSSGRTVEKIPHAYAYDSRVDPRSGDPATTRSVGYRLVRSGSGWSLRMTLDAHWLHSPRRTFPVTVDPVVTDGWTTTYAESGTGNGGDHSYEEFLKVGSYDSGADSANSFVNHWDTSWDDSGVTVTAATLHLFDTWASTCAAPERFDVALVTQAWTPGSVTGYPGPSHGASIGNASPTLSKACGNTASDPAVGDPVTVSLSTSAIQGWMNGTTADHGLAVYASTADALHWKKFGSFMDPAKGPYMVVTYTGNTGPQIYEQYPNSNAVAHTTTPELTAWSSAANSSGGSSTLRYEFTVYDNAGTKVADSGQIAAGDWTVPAGKLAWGQTYYWAVQSYDDSIWSAVPAWSALSVEVPQPVITSGLSQNSSDHGFDPSIGNYTTSDTDADVSTAGPDLSVNRDYNSRDPRWTGAFGAGWSSVLDARAVEQYTPGGAVTAVTVTYPDGSEVGYGRNGDGSFSPPSGRWATFKSVTGGYTLTDKDDTVYTFTQSLGAGGYGITAITDADGNALTFTWSGGHVTKTTSGISGRSLYATWTTPAGAAAAHVQSVHTDPVTGTDASTELTWTYGFTGDQLTSVCAPGDDGNCTRYSYVSGSQYQNASMDLDPAQMWPLSETSGTVAKDAVSANEGTTNATYSNVTLGQPGPLTGGTATAAGFTGASSSYVALPNNTGNDTDSGALSLWFKTSAGPGVIYSYASTRISSGTTTGFYSPAAYVGTDGKLNAAFLYSGGTVPITSASSVADGKWHHMVLSAAGNSQTLYLDNAKVGSVSGSVSIQSAVAFGQNQPYNYLGTGFLGGDWPDEPHHSTTDSTGYATYFTGSIADAAWYDRPLVAADVTSLHQYGTHPASLLSDVTRPSGKVYAHVDYDSATTTVKSLTDESGGHWTIKPPVVSGSSQTYRGAVLGGGPAGYWRLGDTAGAASARDEVHGGSGTYNAVTLGASGPFGDAPAASFNGTSSYLRLPSTVSVTTGPASVEMWFKMPSGNTAGGVLFDQEKCAVDNSPVTCGGYNPALYVGTDGKLHGKFWDSNSTSKQMVTTASVNDGKWHHTILAASGSAQVLYLDGSQAGTTTGTMAPTGTGYDYVGAGAAGGSWPAHPTNTLGYFPGSIAEVGFYPVQLTAQDAQAHFLAAKNSTGLLPVSTVAVTDPGNATLTYRYDVDNGYRMLSSTDGLGNTTSFGYDTGGFEHTVTDPDGDTVTTGHDVRGNTVSTTSCQNQPQNTCSTEYFTYYPDDTTAQLKTADPRNDLLLTSRDGRSASATDTTYLTTYGYDPRGNQTSEITPAVPGSPKGRTTTTAFSDGTTAYPAADSGNVPVGLPTKAVSPGGAVNTVAYFHNGDVASTTDADGLVTKYSYDGIGRIQAKTVVSDTFPAGLVTSYQYDGKGQVTQETEPALTDRVTGATHTPRTSTAYDADGDVISQTVADTTGGDAPRTTSTTYNQYDQVATETDANGSAGADNGATTAYLYDGYGNRTRTTEQDGTTTAYGYDADGHLKTQTLLDYTGDPVNPSAPQDLVESSRAYDPAGRLASITDAMGFTTAYTYTDDGLVATVTKTDPHTGQQYVLEADGYDAAGNLTQRTADNGATVTRYQVDAASRTTSTTLDPAGVNRVTQVSYTPDDMAATTTESDSGGSERVTTGAYDPMGNLTEQTVHGDGSGHPAGWWKLDQKSGSAVPDASGNGNSAQATGVTWSGGAAVLDGSTATGIATNGPVLDTAGSYTVSGWVNLPATPTHNMTLAAQKGTQNSPFYLQYNYTHTGSPGWALTMPKTDTASPVWTGAYSTAAATAGTWTHLAGVYNVSTGALQLYVNGQLAGSGTDTTPFAAPGPLTIGRAWTSGAASDLFTGSVSDVQAYPRALSAAEVSTLYAASRDGGTVGSSDTQTTSWTYDRRGLPTSMTDPDRNETDYSYDEAGNLAVTTSPAVQVETDGDGPTTAHPVTTSGFNTFGEAVEETDPDDNVTVTAYDADGNRTSEVQPPYTPPGSSTPVPDTTTWTYDTQGDVKASRLPDGETTTYAYDQLGDTVQVTDPDGGHTHTVHDPDGDALSVTDPAGAQTQATYDLLGRQLTSTTLERFPSNRALTTVMSYDAGPTNPGGAFLASETTPDHRTTTYGYDGIGEQTSVTDGYANTTRYAYDYLGDPTRTTHPDHTFTQTEYNTAQLPTRITQFDHNGIQLTQVRQTYDGNGNVLSLLDADQNARPAADQHPTTFTYDAGGTVTQEVQPVDADTSVTTGFGYDAAGNRTRYTDGNGNDWTTTYNARNLPETAVAPATDAYTSAPDATTTYHYNGDGQPTGLVQPGGVEVDLDYDELGNVRRQSGTGAEAATATRTYTYDADGRVRTADTAAAGSPGSPGYQPATGEGFTYDDRGDLLTTSGDPGASSFSYTDDGLMASRADAAGTTSYTYDADDRLHTLDDASTGSSLTYGYDADSQPQTVQYGGSGQQRTFTFDDAHRLTGDVLTQGPSTAASIGYGYDPDGNLTSKNTTGFTGAANNTYTYDWANRLTSWDNGAATTAYAYDGAGNRTRVGADVYTYDARDQLTSDGTHTYAYSARGTLTRQTDTSGTRTFTSDAYGQQITTDTQTYGLDASGRVLTDTSPLGGTRTLQYSGADNHVAADGSYTYSYDPGGSLVGINTAGATGTATGQLALTDQHTDVVGTFAPGASALAGSTAYDPLGNVTASSNPFGQLGFQSGWTDTATGKVNMAARWYDPAVGQFTNKDTFAASPVPDEAAANPFAYVGDNPLGDIDPSGHCGMFSFSCHVHAAAHKISQTVKHVTKAAVHVYHKAAKVVRHVVHVARRVVRHVVHKVRDVYRATVHVVHRAYHYVARHVRRVVHTAAHYVKTAYHETKKAAKRVVHAAAHAARTAYHASVKAVKTAAKFTKHHAAAIASFVVSTAVFAGCEAVTAGVGTIGCAAAAGAAGSLVEQGFKCAEDGGSSCSVSSFAGAAVEGGVTGALGGALGALGGKLLSKALPKALEAVGGLFGKGVADATAEGTAEATDLAAEEAASNSAASSAENGAAKAESSGAGGRGGDEPEAGTEGRGGSCRTHSFAGATQVLMADGSAESIDHVKVGDRIRNAVPGGKRTEVHQVEKVIVTHTDHDFVDVTVARAGAGKGRVLRKAALGLAASVAALTAVIGVGGHHAAMAEGVAGADRGAATAAVRETTLTTTFHHPFYDETQSAFVDARDLRVGDVLQSTDGRAEVTAVRAYHANTTTYDLTIAGLHTYYVRAGETPVLVHNCNGEIPYNSDELSGAAYRARGKGGFPTGPYTRAPGGNVAVARVEGYDGLLTGFSKGDGYHSEDHIMDQIDALKAEGHDIGGITHLYSERQPCSVCAGKLPDYLAGNAQITWSVPWGDDGLMNSVANEMLAGMIRRASGGR